MHVLALLPTYKLFEGQGFVGTLPRFPWNSLYYLCVSILLYTLILPTWTCNFLQRTKLELLGPFHSDTWRAEIVWSLHPQQSDLQLSDWWNNMTAQLPCLGCSTVLTRLGWGRGLIWNQTCVWLLPLPCPAFPTPLVDFSWEHFLNKSLGRCCVSACWMNEC